MLSVGLGVVGYILMAMLGFLEAGGVGPQLRAALPSLHSLCISLLWYGLYFGVLGRDCAEVAADRMVQQLPHPCIGVFTTSYILLPSLLGWTCIARIHSLLPSFLLI